jgi:hypothetical protein
VVRPARFAPTPSSNARSAAAQVPPTAARERSTSSGLQGKPSRRTSDSTSLPSSTASTQRPVWTRSSASTSAGWEGMSSPGWSRPWATSASRSRRYLAMGKRWAGGSGTVNPSE